MKRLLGGESPHSSKEARIRLAALVGFCTGSSFEPDAAPNPLCPPRQIGADPPNLPAFSSEQLLRRHCDGSTIVLVLGARSLRWLPPGHRSVLLGDSSPVARRQSSRSVVEWRLALLCVLVLPVS